MILRLASIFCLLLAISAMAAPPPDVSRVLRTIDFDERDDGNNEDLPMYWVKVEGPNLPHYVNARLTTDNPRSGQYSFRFDLNGGSLIYRYDPQRIKVQPGAHYRIEGYVRTSPLKNARARITGYFTDADGRILSHTARHSEPYVSPAPNAPWKKLTVELSNTYENAAYLVMEIGLLQPAHYAQSTLGAQAVYTQDIHGTAWFDDVTVSQVPKVTMTTDRPGNIFRRSDRPELQVLVNDRSTDDLAAQLVITNAAGQRVFQRTGALDMTAAVTLGPGRKQTPLILPQLPPGWYEATLVMSSRGQYVGEQTLHFVLLADDSPQMAPDPRFGLIATNLPFDGWDELPAILPYLGAGRVKLGVWSEAGDVEQIDSARFDNLLEGLQAIDVTPTAVLVSLPPSIASKLNNPSWLSLLHADRNAWQPDLAFMIARHANHLDRWQLGDDNSDAFVTQPAMRAVYDTVYSEFTNLMKSPDLAMPWPAWYDLDGKLPATVALSVPPSVLPSQLPLYMQDLRAREGHNLSLSLQLLDRDQYGRDVQIRDFAQRVIYALAAGANRIDIPLPFTVKRDGDTLVKQPQEMLLVARTLMTVLSGTTFKGQVPIADGVEAFVFDRGGQGIMVLWDKGNTSGLKQLELNLGQQPMLMDLWGRVTPLLHSASQQSDGKVQLELGPMPVILVDIDGYIAQLRASIALDRPLLESSFKPHTRKIRFVNPYRQAIGGSLKLKAPAGWTVNPPTFNFNLNPGEVFEREITLEFPYNSFAGTKLISAEFNVQADRNTSFVAPLLLKLGLSDVGMQTIALREGKDLIVQQIISNYGDHTIDYTAFAIVPGHARQERLVTNLGAGRTTIKRYRFQNVKLPPDAKVRVGIKELEGTRILNDEVPVQ